MANGYIGLANIGNDYYKIGSTAYVELNAGTNGSITQSADKVDFVVPFDGFVNATGATIHVKFVQANTVSDKTLYLKVGGTDPYQIINPNGSETWAAGSVISFTFDGEHWVMNSSQISVDASQLDIPGFGNISKAGTLTNSAAAAATGDALVIVDTSDNEGRVAKSNILFNTANTDYFLTQAGGWTQLNKSVWGLDNVTNHAQVTSLQWDTTNKRITYKISEGDAQNIVSFVAGDNITLNAAANQLTITGKAGTITSITPGAGLVNGSNTQTAITESGTIKIKTGGVTNDMLAGSITPGKLADTATISIGTQSIKVGGSFDTATLLQDLSLSSAMHYKGEVAAIPPASGTYVAGDVVTLEDTAKEYVYDGTNWRELGSESSYKLVQTAVSDPTVPANGETTSNSFIATISQNSQGVITVTKRNVPVISVAGLTGAIDATDLQSALSLSNYIPKSIGTAAGDIIYWNAASDPKRLAKGTNGQVLKMVNNLPAWATDTSEDPTVTQNIVAITDTNDYPLLLSHYNRTTTTTKQTVNHVSTIYANKDGELHATSFYGNGANITGITTDHINGIDNGGTKYLRQDGWKTVTLDTSKAITSVSHNNDGAWPTVSDGAAATFEVINGVLIITPGSDVSYSTSNAKFPTVKTSDGDFANGTITVS